MNKIIINNNYDYGIGLPPQINTPSIFKNKKILKLF
jgi:hypothetical protein